MWIDSHCHLTHERIRDFASPEALVRQANDDGIDGMLTISCQIAGDFKDQLRVAKAYQNVWCSVGTHPHDSGLQAEKDISAGEIVRLANSDDKIVAIGECGLDYFYDNSPREDQAAGFRKHIDACLETDLPIIVHSRDAEEDTAAILKEQGLGKLTGVMHCFSSKAALAEKALELGMYISFSGIVTFKAAEELREVAKVVPKDRILVETDAPFLAPVPYRGQTNQPAYVAHTGAFLAELLGMSSEALAGQTTENFFRCFPKAKKTWVS